VGREDLRGSGNWNVSHTFGWATPGILDGILRRILNIESTLLLFFSGQTNYQLDFSPRTQIPIFMSDTGNGCKGYHRIARPLCTPLQRPSNFFRPAHHRPRWGAASCARTITLQVQLGTGAVRQQGSITSFGTRPVQSSRVIIDYSVVRFSSCRPAPSTCTYQSQ
jgi:hypothetical protein